MVLLHGCAASGPKLYRPGELAPEQLARLQAAEKLYRQGDPQFPAERDALAGDPVAACWLCRMLVRDLLHALDGGVLAVDPLVSAAAHKPSRPEQIADHIEALGGAAVPCLVQDLVRHPQSHQRTLGATLLGRIGGVAVPELLPLVQDREPDVRRGAALALGALLKQAPAAGPPLQQLATDAVWEVRGDAVRGLGNGGPAEAAVLRRVLVQDSDAFVRNEAAKALGNHRDRDSAAALIQHLERCKRELNHRGEEAAQDALRKIAGAKGPRTVEAWRRWLDGYNPAPAAAGPR